MVWGWGFGVWGLGFRDQTTEHHGHQLVLAWALRPINPRATWASAGAGLGFQTHTRGHHGHQLVLALALRPKPPNIMGISWCWCGLSDAHPRASWASAGAGLGFQTQTPEHHGYQLVLARAFRPTLASIMGISWCWLGLSDPNPRASWASAGAGLGFQTQTPEHHGHQLVRARLSDPHPRASWASAGAGLGFQTQTPEHHGHQLALARAFRPTSASIMGISWCWLGLSDPHPRASWASAGAGLGFQTHTRGHHGHQLVLARALRPKPPNIMGISWCWRGLSDAHPRASWASAGAGLGFQTQTPEHHGHQLVLARAFRPKPPSIMGIS